MIKGQHNSPTTEFKKGQNLGEKHPRWKGGKPKCVDCGKQVSNYGVKRCSKCKGKAISGTNHYRWKGGITRTLWQDKKYIADYWRNKRHKEGISKRYKEEIVYDPTRAKNTKRRYKYFKKIGGELTIATIQQVYEDNIKCYGTLTCYLCLETIPFGKDHLEHKTPLSRGGTNIRDNLDVACQKCNCRKNNKTEEEYRKEILTDA